MDQRLAYSSISTRIYSIVSAQTPYSSRAQEALES